MIWRLNIKTRPDYESSCQYYKMSVKLLNIHGIMPQTNNNISI